MTKKNHYKFNLGYFNYDAALQYGERPALIDLSGSNPREINHAELNQRMDRVASGLCTMGLKTGDRLLLAMSNRYEFVEAFFGAMRAGVVPIPLNTKLGAETISFIIDDCRCNAAIIEPSCNPQLENIIDKKELSVRIALPSPHSGWTDYDNWISTNNVTAFQSPEIPADQVAFLPYTSGSTGRPKGVLLTHSGMLWAIRLSQEFWPCTPEDRTLVAGPLYHKNAMRVSIKPKLYVGASAVILPKFEPQTFLRSLADFGCTDTGGVPAMYRMMLAEEELLSELQFPNLKTLEMGSAVVGAELIQAVERKFGAQVEEAYGLTEGGGPLRQPIDGRSVPRGSCGVVSPGVDIKLMDENGKINPHEGELWVRSPAVLAGYNNRPELNKERLTDGWLHTNDIFHKDKDGFFFFKGRTDDQFSCGGENIQPKEVELLLVQHPSVIDAVVVPIKHEVKGLAPAALVTQRPDRPTDEVNIKNFCLEYGPAYAHPRRVICIDNLPIGGTGKVDRKLAKEIVEQAIASGTTFTD